MIKIIVTRKSTESNKELIDVIEKIAKETLPLGVVEIIPDFTKPAIESAKIKIIISEDELRRLTKSLEYIRIRFTNPRVPDKNSNYRLKAIISIQPAKLFKTP